MKLLRVLNEGKGDSEYLHVPTPSLLARGGMLTICGWNDVHHEYKNANAPTCVRCLLLLKHCAALATAKAKGG